MKGDQLAKDAENLTANARDMPDRVNLSSIMRMRLVNIGPHQTVQHNESHLQPRWCGLDPQTVVRDDLILLIDPTLNKMPLTPNFLASSWT